MYLWKWLIWKDQHASRFRHEVTLLNEITSQLFLHFVLSTPKCTMIHASVFHFVSDIRRINYTNCSYTLYFFLLDTHNILLFHLSFSFSVWQETYAAAISCIWSDTEPFTSTHTSLCNPFSCVCVCYLHLDCGWCALMRCVQSWAQVGLWGCWPGGSGPGFVHCNGTWSPKSRSGPW